MNVLKIRLACRQIGLVRLFNMISSLNLQTVTLYKPIPVHIALVDNLSTLVSP